MENAIQAYLTDETREMLDFIFDGVYIVDTKRKILFWNKGAELITGYGAEEVMGKYCRDNILNHTDENGNLLCNSRCPLLKSVDRGEFVREKVYPLHHSGHRFPVYTHVGPIKDKAGNIIGAIEVFRDISAEEKLHRTEIKFRKLVKQYISETTYETVWNAVSQDSDMSASMKDLTIMFTDIVSFTAMSEQHSAEKIVEMLNYFFSAVSHIVRKYTGDIDKFIGDCAMSVFIDAQDAVNAAKEIIHTGLPILNKTLISKQLPEINLRVGINSGNLVHGNIGSSERKDMTVIGDVVNTASRVQGEADPGSFLITENTLARLDQPQEFGFAKEILLKGKRHPIRLYRLGGYAAT